MSRFDQRDAPDDDPFGDYWLTGACSQCGQPCVVRNDESEVWCEPCRQKQRPSPVVTKDEDAPCPL